MSNWKQKWSVPNFMSKSAWKTQTNHNKPLVQLIYQVMFDVSECQVTFPMLFHVSGGGKKSNDGWN